VTVASRRVTIVNERGLHARASRLFVVEAIKFRSAVTVRRDDLTVPADSVLSLLECAAGPGTEIEIAADGPDAEAAVDALAKLVEAGFYEEGMPSA
jgi:phosphocarrier protein